MIINSQLFYSRVIIASLVLVIVILGFFSYQNYNALIESQMFIEQEKSLVENELSEMISSYEVVEVQNASIAKQLEETKLKIVTILDSVKQLKPSTSVISKYKAQIKVLRAENLQLLAWADTLETENAALRLQSESIANSLDSAISLQSKQIPQKETVVMAKRDLKTFNELSITNIVAEGVKAITSSKTIVNTKHASNTSKFHVCFKLLKNDRLEKGPKDIYIQILDSRMNVVASKGTLNYGKNSLIYSAKKTIDYNNEDLKICNLIDKEEENLIKGIYFISVFYEGIKLGRTTIELN